MADQRIFNVLFLCVGNSARSIIAECLLNRIGQGRFAAFSAGSSPRPAPMPDVLRVLTRKGYRTEMLRSKSWQEFTGPHAPALDFVITLCDEIRGDRCPRWPGEPLTTHWSIFDPANPSVPSASIEAAIEHVSMDLERRIKRLCALPIDKLERLALHRRLEEIAAEGLTRAAGACRLPE